MNITIVGTGYQGLVVGTCLADNGHQVICVDRDAARIAALTAGKMPIHEPGLEELVTRNLEEERLSFTTDLGEAVANSLAIFLCVGTPLRPDGSADISEVLEATRQVAARMNGYRIVVNKSTCPPGTAEELEKILKESAAHAYDIVVNPDFLKEGTAIDDFMKPDRVVMGCDDVRVREILKELYSPFLRTGRPFLVMGKRSAELCKFATNVFLATRISLLSQLADLCEAYGADIAEVRDGTAFDERIGMQFMFPGLGFGGLGLPKDLATTIQLARDKGIQHDLLSAVLEINQRRQEGFLARILGHYGAAIGQKKIAVWGASFKPRTDDLRGAISLKIIDGLCAAGRRSGRV
jgi:UDPglucose 6-dehydrogenase